MSPHVESVYFTFSGLFLSRSASIKVFGLDEACTDFESLSFTLRCIREQPGEGILYGAAARCRLLWIEWRTCGPRMRLPEPGSDVDVTFELPRGLPGTCLRDVYPTYWELQVEGKSGAGRYDERFLVPIYAEDSLGDG